MICLKRASYVAALTSESEKTPKKSKIDSVSRFRSKEILIVYYDPTQHREISCTLETVLMVAGNIR